MTQASSSQPPRASSHRPVRRMRVGAVIAVALVVAFAAWLIFRDNDDNGSGSAQPASAAATPGQLRAIPQETGQELYWAGRRAGYTYELTRTKDGNNFIRYLPAGVPVGAQQPNYLTVGTYPRRRALQGLRRLGRRQNSVSFEVPRNGIAVYSRERPTSVYLAFPGEDVQVEVFDPNAQRARRFARDGRIRPIS
jgi:hypothetical protein